MWSNLFWRLSLLTLTSFSPSSHNKKEKKKKEKSTKNKIKQKKAHTQKDIVYLAVCWLNVSLCLDGH